MREPSRVEINGFAARYTLTYNEGTTVSGLKVLDMAIYPHI